MKADIVTIFPDFFRGPLDHGITRRACEMGLAEIEVHDLRKFTHDRHRTVDDRPFGGGEGMVLKPEPIFECLEPLAACFSGATFVRRGERKRDSAFRAGRALHAEGCERVSRAGSHRADLRPLRRRGRARRGLLADRELSIGDYIISGGELAAAVIIEAVTRLLPGAVGNEASTRQESFTAQDAGRGSRAARIRLAAPADCSTIRTTRVLLSFAGWRCRKYWSTAIIWRSGAGGASRR